MSIVNDEYCVGIPELFSLNWNKDPCIEKKVISCSVSDLATKPCPVGVDFFRFPSGELRLDYAHCNLKCIPCWAKQCPHEEHFNCYQSSYGKKENFGPEEIVNTLVCRAKKLNEYVEAKKTFQIRITGGEPFLSRQRWDHLNQLLKILDRKVNPKQPDYNKHLDDRLHDYGKRGQPKRKRVVIQTNGIQLGETIPFSDLANLTKNLEKISLLIHLSMKGSKPIEFNLITKANAEMFTNQVDSIRELFDISESNDNFDFQIVFGFFHSDKFILWNPQEDEPMLTNPDSTFLAEVIRNWKRTYVEPLDFRLRMIENAGTIAKCLNNGIVKERSQISKKIISELEPLPLSGKKTRICNTFWKNFS